MFNQYIDNDDELAVILVSQKHKARLLWVGGCSTLQHTLWVLSALLHSGHLIILLFVVDQGP